MRSPEKWALLAVVALLVPLLALGGSPADAQPEKVLILETTVSGGLGSQEASDAMDLGFDVDLVSEAEWAALTAADFASYRAIILGDPNCVFNVDHLAPVAANTNVWGPVVDGNVILIGTDPVFHSGITGARQLTRQGIEFATDEPGATGLYATTSCYYDNFAPGTPIPAFDGLDGGGFTGTGSFNLPVLDDVRIVAAHPALEGLTSADLSNWGISVHQSFDTWPGTFEVLAVARSDEGPFVAPDGTIGFPYILARGEAVTPFQVLTLTPDEATLTVGAEHEVTAEVLLEGVPEEGAEVEFEVIAGPHEGTTGTGITAADGFTNFTYTGTSPGTDTIVATWDAGFAVFVSNEVTATWEGVGPDPEPVTPAPVAPAPLPLTPAPAPVATTPTFTG